MKRFNALLLAASLSLMAAPAMTNCARANPVVTATHATTENQPETIAFALHNSFVVVAERAATIAEDSTTPPAVKRVLVTSYKSAAPVARNLRAAAQRYVDVRASFTAGQSTAEQVATALTELQQLITEFAPKLNELSVTINGGAK